MNRVEGHVGHVVRGALCSAGRHYPLYRGCGRLANLPLPVSLSSASDPLSLVTLRDGSRVWVRLDDFLGRALYYFGDFDRRLTWLLRRVLRPGDAFVDIGANYGWLSLTASKIVGPAGVVHAVEPQPTVLELLRRSIETSGTKNVVVHPVGVSDASSHMTLWIPAGKFGSASLTRDGSAKGRSIQVPVVHAGTFFCELGLDRVRLLKLDVEGHEDHVIRGAEAWLKNGQVESILFEWNDPRPVQTSDTVRILRELGYELFQVERTTLKPRVTPMSARTSSANDYLALLPGCADIRERVVE
jgi:FkbM family methyltransferase